MIQKIIHRHKSDSGREFIFFDNGICATAFKSPHFDVEIEDQISLAQKMTTVLESLPTDFTVRFSSLIDYEYSPVNLGNSRDEAISQVGRTKSVLVITFEKQYPKISGIAKGIIGRKTPQSTYLDFINEFDSQIRVEFLDSFCKDFDEFSYEDPFLDCCPRQSKAGLQIENAYYSVIKLHKPSNYEIDPKALAYLRDALPSPAIIASSIRKMGEAKKQSTVNSTYEREKTGRDATSYEKFQAAGELKRDIELKGTSLFNIELSIILSSKSEESLLNLAFETKNKLKQLGDFGVETIGCFPSLKAALPGGKFHHTIYDNLENTVSYLPLFIRGNDSPKNPSKGATLLHRSDGTVDSLDLFDKTYPNYSAIIVGRSGLGKSVLTNAIIDSCYNDPSMKINIVDVLGSYTKMVEQRGGYVNHLGSDSKATISPFQKVRAELVDAETIEILGDWLEKLLLEKDEEYLSNGEQAKIENLLKGYFDSSPKSPSLEGFGRFAKDIPRKDSFSRWLKGGNYDHIFSDYKVDLVDSRLMYGNFKNLVSAQKPGISQAIMNSEMANFYLDTISKSKTEKRLFIIDESPTLLKNWFRGLCILMRNLRKTYSSILLVGQDLPGLTIKHGNGIDKTLIRQPTTRIFFSEDEGSDSFLQDSGLTKEGLAILRGFKQEKGKKSQFIIKDTYGERVGYLYQSKKEYFRTTTESYDEAKIEAVQKALGLPSLFKAAEVLGQIEGLR